MAQELKLNFGSGGAKLDQFSENNIYDMVKILIQELQLLQAALNDHTHTGGAVAIMDQSPVTTDITIES